MKKLNLTNTALISLIISLICLFVIGDPFRSQAYALGTFLAYFLMGWIIPFIPYGISLFINWAIAYDTTKKVFELFKVLWIIMSFFNLYQIIFEFTY